MSAAAKRTLLLAASLLALVAVSVVGAAGGAPPGKDREAPSAPKNLRVSAVTQTLVRLAWDPSTDNVAVTGYYVFGDRGKATVETRLDMPEFTLGRLACGQSTDVTVVAFDDSENRSEKATLTVSSAPCTDTLPPVMPSGFMQVATSDDAVVLAWNPSADNVGVVGYGVYRNLQRVASPSDPTVPLAGLVCGSSYDYAVDAVDAAGNRSLLARARVQTSACPSSPPPPAPSPDTQPPSTPSGLAAASITQSALTLSWNPSTDNVQVTGYDLYRNGSKVASPSAPGASQSGLACGASYTFAVEALDAARNRSSRATLTTSTSACSTTPPPPAPSPDTQPPSTPSGLAAASITQSALTLSWNPSTDNVQVTGYDLYRNGSKVASPSAPGASQSGLACGASYTFAVEALDAARNRSSRATLTTSTSACSTTPPPPAPSPDTQPPSTPSGLAAASITQSALTLSWNPSTDNVQVTGYDLYRNGSKVASPSAPGASQSGLACGASYTFAVEALDAARNRSSRATLTTSTSACSTTPPPPAPSPDTQAPSTPSGLGVSSATRTSASLSWNPSTDNVAVEGYRSYRNSGYQSMTTQPTTTISGLSCGSAYTFEVDAFDAEGNASNRASVIGSTLSCPDTQAPTAPSGVVASSRTATSIALTWSASTDNVGVTGYGLYRGGSLVGTGTTTTGIFSGLTCNTNYTLAVDAYDAAGNRSSQIVVMVSTTACADTTAPSAPSGLATSNVTQTGLTLAWNASSDNVGVTRYDVYRNGSKVGAVTSTSFSQTGLGCGATYSLGVVALDAAGNSSTQAQLTASTAPCSTSGAVAPFYVADLETGDFSQVISQQESTPDRITLATSSPLQGTYSALVKDGPSDANVAGSQTSLRAEMEFGTISSRFFGGGSLEGKDTWITWEQRLDPNWEIGQTWAVITQFLGSSGSGWPMFAIQANGPAPGKLYAVVRGGAVSENSRAVVLADPLPLGQNLRFKVYHRWSTGSGGVVKVWINGVLKATILGPNLFIGYESTPYHKGGIYRSSSGITRDSQLVIDNVRWWRSDPG